MKNILKNIFTQSDNETYSFTRIFLIPPFMVIFLYRMVIAKDTLENIGYAMMFALLGLGCVAFLSKFIEDGTVKDIIQSFKK